MVFPGYIGATSRSMAPRMCLSGLPEQPLPLANRLRPRTTKLYDRTNDRITLDEIERIVI